MEECFHGCVGLDKSDGPCAELPVITTAAVQFFKDPQCIPLIGKHAVGGRNARRVWSIRGPRMSSPRSTAERCAQQNLQTLAFSWLLLYQPPRSPQDAVCFAPLHDAPTGAECAQCAAGCHVRMQPLLAASSALPKGGIVLLPLLMLMPFTGLTSVSRPNLKAPSPWCCLWHCTLQESTILHACVGTSGLLFFA